jgi:hypothetical protein
VPFIRQGQRKARALILLRWQGSGSRWAEVTKVRVSNRIADAGKDEGVGGCGVFEDGEMI